MTNKELKLEEEVTALKSQMDGYKILYEHYKELYEKKSDASKLLNDLHMLIKENNGEYTITLDEKDINFLKNRYLNLGG